MFSPTSILRSISASATSINPLLKARQVRILTIPAPNSLVESRLILAELQKFGEVSTFRNLKYAYNNYNNNESFIYQEGGSSSPSSSSSSSSSSPTPSIPDDRVCFVIFETAEAARKAIDASPLKIPLVAHRHASGQTPPSPGISISVKEKETPDVADSTNLSSSSPPSVLSKEPTPNPDLQQHNHQHHHRRHPKKFLTCTITPSNHNHQASIMNRKENPYYGPFGTIRNNYELKDMAYYDVGVGGGSRAGAAPGYQVAGFTQASRMDLKEHIRERLKEESKRLGAGSLMALFNEGMEMRKSGVDYKGRDGGGGENSVKKAKNDGKPDSNWRKKHGA